MSFRKSRSRSPRKYKNTDEYYDSSDNESELEKEIKIHTKNVKDMNKLSKLLNIKLISKTHKVSANTNKVGFNLDHVPEFDNTLNKDFCSTRLILSDLLKWKLNKLDLDITNKTKILWYPERPVHDLNNTIYITTKPVNPRYPVYIISKGRYESRLTSIALEKMDVPYKIVIEPQEFDQYAKYINPEKILILPDKYLNKNQASIPARNFCWEHSIKNKATHHWILDDNIRRFFRFNNNKKIEVRSGVCFRVIEDMMNQFTNVGLAGMQYSFFINEICSTSPIAIKNTRVYSCILIKGYFRF